MGFPKDFVWGSATASYQVEGSALEDGRGECIWYRFSHTPGNIVNDDTGDVACDQVHRYREDVALMRQLGHQAYRFSIAWARVLPQGTGASNPLGLDYYDRLVDELLANDILPFVTLYHWDLPQAIQDRGGWEVPESIQWFCDYADLMTRRLGDRVKHWTTFNEPQVTAFAGHADGKHAPGKTDLPTAYRVAHHLLLAHGTAVPVIRANVPGAQAGIVLNLHPAYPLTDSQADIDAVRRQDGRHNRWFLDPVFKGEYPADTVALLDGILDGIDLSSVKQAAAPLDYLGVNYYFRNVVAAADSVPFKLRFAHMDGHPHTAMGWEVNADALRDLLVRLTRDYTPAALYITENGSAYDDPVPGEHTAIVEDPQRVAYLEEHLDACAAVIDQGVPLKGYFAWSLLDNFEWGHGYSKRFGIVYVDYKTLRRIPKRSALVYRDRIARHRAGG